jgi:hypothetical protein
MIGTHEAELHVKSLQDLPPLENSNEPPSISVHGRFVRKRNLSYVGFNEAFPLATWQLMVGDAAAKDSYSVTFNSKMEARQLKSIE